MAKNIMTSGIEMSDVIKATGFPVPEDMEGKTFAEVVEGGGSGDITVEALTATENKVYTAPEGKAYSPVTVNVPTPTTMYCWVDNLDPHEDKAYCVIPNPKVGDKVFWTDADSVYSVATITATTETTLTTSKGTVTRDSTEDVVLVS